jgi:hypothetical protein
MILSFNFKISGMYDDGTSELYSRTEDYNIINYEPGNAKERFEGAKNGKGTLYYKNGLKLMGNFNFGRIDGSAKLVSANGDILKSGTFIQTRSDLYFVEEELKILTGKISDDSYTAKGKLYFTSNKIFIGVFEFFYEKLWSHLKLVGEGQLIDGNGEKIEEGICSLKEFRNIQEGIEEQYGIYFGKDTSGTVSGKIHLTNGKTYQGEFENHKHDGAEYFNPIEGTLFSYDGTIIQEGKWEDGVFVG